MESRARKKMKEEEEKLLSSYQISLDICNYPLLDLTTEIHLREAIRATSLNVRLIKSHQH